MNEVEIISYQPNLGEFFKSISYEWLEKYFGIEETDREVLENHQTNIIDKGGHILFARVSGQIVGTCALINHGEGIYELAKLGIIESHQGLKIGEKLTKAVIEKAKVLKAKYVVLESSNRLKKALKLYEKLGFVEDKYLIQEPFSRCNIQLMLKFEYN
jgi:ribosomal protein S18 acetylase RimI-like enzyme